MFKIFKHFSKFSANSKELKYAWLISFYRRIIIRKNIHISEILNLLNVSIKT